MEDVVQATVAAGSLHRQDVQWLLHHADHRTVPAVAVADAAGIGVGDVLTDGAEGNALLHLQDRLGQGMGLGGGHAEQVVGEPLGELGAHAGKFVELLDEAGHRPRGRGGLLVHQAITSRTVSGLRRRSTAASR